MKILKQVVIGDTKKNLINSNIILELSAAGRGFVVVDAVEGETFVNKTIRIDLGYYNNLQRWFTGYVESEQHAQNGTKKLLIRELIGVYSQQIKCSFQHPTINDITNYLTEKYQLKFDLPDSDYINTKIPHFKHDGTGYHLLSAIGRAFNINDFVFYQKQSGKIYLGSYKDCYYASRALDFGDNLNKSALRTASVDEITLPFIPKIRPGVIINKRRVKRVNLINDELTITFDNKEISSFKSQVIKNYPEISSGYHLPIFGRVVAITDVCNSGDISTPFRPRYAVDVQLLDENGEDSTTPVLKAVPLPVALGGWEKGAFCYPDVGSIVDVAFAYGRADQPIVRNVYPINAGLPQVRHGEILIQQRAEVYQRIDKIGNTTRETDQELHDISRDYFVTADYQENNVTQRLTTITADDEINVLGNSVLNSGSHSTATVADYGLAVGGNHYHAVKASYTCSIESNKIETVGSQYKLKANSINTTVNKDIQITAQQISEQAASIYSIIAGTNVQIIAPSVWVGSNQLNVTQLMLDTLSLIKRLAELTANHNHQNTGAPLNAPAINQVGIDASGLDDKYSPIISK